MTVKKDTGGKMILIADDEKDLLELLEYTFTGSGYEVVTAENGDDALALAKERVPDIAILDIMMPGMDGIEVCRNMRADARFENTSIIILTARGEEYSEIAGFDAGADDYVTKPVRLRSLVKRIESFDRRNQRRENQVIDVAPFRIDREKYLVSRNGEDIRLPRKEFELLFLLASRPGKVVTREEIMEKVWGNDVIVVDRTIDVHIRRVRKKIGEETIQTIKGVGYKFVP